MANRFNAILETLLWPACRRIADIVVGCFCTLLLSGPIVLIGIGVKVGSPGPIFFRQWRIGRDGRRHRVLRFRTMAVLDDGSSVLRLPGKSYPRITAFGRFLRRRSLDHMPFVVSLATGGTSLFGARAIDLSDKQNDTSELARNETILRHVGTFFDFVAVFLPRRLAKEDVGDAMEDIGVWSKKYRGRCFRIMVAWKVATTVFFLGLNTVREIVSSLLGKKRGG